MSNETRAEFESMINEAWDHYDTAIISNDMELAELFKQEAFHLLSKLPQDRIQIRTHTH